MDAATSSAYDRIMARVAGLITTILARDGFTTPERVEALGSRRRAGYRMAAELSAVRKAREDAAAAVKRAEEALESARKDQACIEAAADIIEARALEDYADDHRHLRRRLDQHDRLYAELEALRADPDADPVKVARTERNERGVWNIAEALGDRTALVRRFLPSRLLEEHYQRQHGSHA